MILVVNMIFICATFKYLNKIELLPTMQSVEHLQHFVFNSCYKGYTGSSFGKTTFGLDN